MSVDKFGRYDIGGNKRRFPMKFSSLLLFDNDGNLNLDDKRIINVHYPSEKNDVATKQFVEQARQALEKRLQVSFDMLENIRTAHLRETYSLREESKTHVELINALERRISNSETQQNARLDMFKEQFENYLRRRTTFDQDVEEKLLKLKEQLHNQML